jgi:hypothetical protein
MTPQNAIALLKGCLGYGNDEGFTEAVECLAGLVFGSEDSIRVRIAVAVSADGWVGCHPCGEAYDSSEAMRSAVVDTAESDLVAQAFIEADIPRTPTVQARTMEATT